MPDEADRPSSAVAGGYPATVGELKARLDEYDDHQPIAGHTTDGEGNWFLYPVDVVKMPGNNDKVLIDLTPSQGAG